MKFSVETEGNIHLNNVNLETLYLELDETLTVQFNQHLCALEEISVMLILEPNAQEAPLQIHLKSTVYLNVEMVSNIPVKNEKLEI